MCFDRLNSQWTEESLEEISKNDSKWILLLGKSFAFEKIILGRSVSLSDSLCKLISLNGLLVSSFLSIRRSIFGLVLTISPASIRRLLQHPINK